MPKDNLCARQDPATISRNISELMGDVDAFAIVKHIAIQKDLDFATKRVLWNVLSHITARVEQQVLAEPRLFRTLTDTASRAYYGTL